MNHQPFVIALSVALFAAGCSGRGAPPVIPETAPPVAPAVDPQMARLPLGERLAHEAATRPAARLRAEEVAAALAARGMALRGWKQVLASPLGARFCMAGQTPGGAVVAICEFADGDQAARGTAYSHATFDRLIPRRTLTRRGATLLTVARPDDSPALAADAQAVTGLFQSL